MFRRYQIVLTFLLFTSELIAQTKDYKAEYIKGYRGGYIKNQESIDGALEFAVVGDFGRGGEYYQKDMAANLAKAVTGINASFIISTGDNIYPDGVASVHDPLWNLSFENVFYQYPLHRPWYVVLGNHDYHQNPQAEVDYSQISGRWNMPARYHSFKQRIGTNAEALFVFIDTNPLEPSSYNSSYRDELIRQDSTRQKQWLEKVLSDTSSTVKWKIVIGHHPLYTAGNRALNKPEMRYTLEPLFEKYKVNVYISGHEHHLQYYHPPQKFTHHFISGAGSEANESLQPRGPVDFFAPIQGFMTFSITPNQLLMQAINRKGKVLKKLTVANSNK
ncbi:metallophosphoesterase [Mucilaginibacter sp. Bleaf8]|uniref:metallophosphoesterase n=1 Tax=Mucilaginibacter sp. Bleaf8 TaxID=2834430 RepID=UPI001BCC1E1A|nr:metallophosphoesterase [Mucilaginibacter sp. Bleaf8]MBS7562929.1 metallophosphoesterase [Mucilaginibacter sp. Bleaf8]